MHTNMSSFQVVRSQYTQIIAMTITLGAFLCSALALAHALQDHFGSGLGDFAVYTPSPSPANCEATCEKIAKAISSKSQVFYPGKIRVLHLYCATPIDSRVLGSQEFKFDISHWANTSSQVPICSVEPGTPDDVGLTVNLTHPPSTDRCIADVYMPTAPEDCYRSRSVCCKRRWPCYQPWLFVNPGCTHLDDPVQ
jgi:hypothetical protein